VSESGDDNNDGKTLASAFRTVHKALEVAEDGNAIRPGDVIHVKSGNHVVENPVVIPAFCTIMGDNLRTTFIRPANPSQDLFYVKKGCYVNGFTFKGHRDGAAVVSFPPDGSAGEITTSPYVQNCSSITSDGVGMRIDGSLVTGTRSMVCDAFTQINVGGIGVHLLNRGYAQLVSIFTITCDIGIKAESGGFCSITNSNCSFGNYGLWATGVSDPLYSATTVDSALTFQDVISVSGVAYKPSYGDAIKIGDKREYYTVNASTTIFSTGNSSVYPKNEGNYTNAASILDNNNATNGYIADKMVEFVEANFPVGFATGPVRTRDATNLLTALAADLRNGGYDNIKSTAKRVYFTNALNTFEPLRQGTSDTIRYTKTLIDDLFNQTPDSMVADGGLTAEDSAYDVAKSLINIYASDIIANKTAAAGILNINKGKQQYVANKVIEYVADNYPDLEYDSNKCRRDIRFLFEAVGADMTAGGRENVEDAGRYYFNAVTNTFEGQRFQTSDAIRYINTLIPDILNPTLDSSRLPVIDGIEYDSDLTAQLDSISQFEIIERISEYADAVDGQYRNAVTIINNNLGLVVDSDDDPEPAERTKPDDIVTATGILSQKVIEYITARVASADSAGDVFFNFTDYDSTKCRRDVGLILQGVAQDMVAGGVENSELGARLYHTAVAPTFEDQRLPTAAAVQYIADELIEPLLLQDSDTLTGMVRDESLTAEYNSVRIAKSLIADIADAIDGNATTQVTIEPALDEPLPIGTPMTFHQRSLITASSITFEFVGSGIDIKKAEPRFGGVPIQENEIIQDDDGGGQVYFTSTDQRGDFRIGTELTINRQAGTIEGDAFDRSLFAVLTPYILALED